MGPWLAVLLQAYNYNLISGTWVADKKSAREVGRELKIRYFLEESACREAERVHVTPLLMASPAVSVQK
jgi:TolB-like protein